MELISDGKPLYLASEGGKTFRLIEDWKFKHDQFFPVLIVPEGYKSDLASIPSWIFWWQWGKWNIAAIAHDYIYEHGYILSDWEDGRRALFMGKEDADKLFCDICCFLGVPTLTAKLMYRAVRLFGRGVWACPASFGEK
jgi:Protein of unknown function (DUF1353)